MLSFLWAVVNNTDQKFACDIVDILILEKRLIQCPTRNYYFKLWLMGITGDLWF